MSTSRTQNLMGFRSGRLRVIASATPQDKGAWWLCACDCGTQRVVSAAHLKSGRTRSCGCWQREITSQRFKIHGQAHDIGRRQPSREYNSWQAAIARCEVPTTDGYEHYGGRGIQMCPQWRQSFPAFLRDMGPRPVGTSLDRINTDDNYAPDNCRWADPATQRRNRRKR